MLPPGVAIRLFVRTIELAFNDRFDEVGYASILPFSSLPDLLLQFRGDADINTFRFHSDTALLLKSTPHSELL